jgi:hypothetical protein
LFQWQGLLPAGRGDPPGNKKERVPGGPHSQRSPCNP